MAGLRDDGGRENRVRQVGSPQEMLLWTQVRVRESLRSLCTVACLPEITRGRSGVEIPRSLQTH